MTRQLLTLLLVISYFNISAQSDSSDYESLAKAYEFQNSEKRDSAILLYKSAALLFKKNENWNKYVECLAGENRNYLGTDRIGDVEAKGVDAVEIVDAQKAEEVNEYFIEILTQLSRFYWYAKGNFPQSLKYLNRASKICNRADFDVEKHRLKIFTEYGYTYGYSGEFDLSEKNFRDALNLAIELYGDDSEVVADRYTDMVFPLIQKSEWEKAEVALKKAIELNIKIRGPEHRAVLKNYNNLGYIYMEKFDNDQAILYINKAIEMIRKQFGESHRSIGIGYMNIGSSYSNRGDYRTGLKYTKMAIENFKTSIGDKSPYIGICLQNIGNEYNHMGIYDSAELFYNKALKFKIGLYGKNHPDIVNMYTYLTNFYLKTKNYEQAFSIANEALEIAAKVLPEKHKYSGNSHLGLSQCYAAVHKYEESLQEVQLAIMGLMPEFNDPDFSSNPDLNTEIISTRILIEALMLKTQSLKEYYEENDELKYLELAYQTADVTDRALDILRIEYQTPESKEILLSRSKEFYEQALEITFLLNDKLTSEEYIDKAFQYIEKSKSILLIEHVKSSKDFAMNNLPDSIAIEEKSLSRSIAYYKEQIFEARNQNDSASLTKSKDRYFEKKRDHDLLLNFIKENYPDYFSVRHAVFNKSLKAVQNNLNNQEMMISYFYGKQHLYAIGISKRGFDYHIIDLDDQLQSPLAKLVESFENRNFDPEISHLVFEEILQPLIGDEDIIKSIVVLPDGILHYLPFESFVTSTTSGSDSRFLIHDYTVSYLYTTSLPESYRQSSTDSDLSYIGFSPSYNIASNPLLASRSARDVQIASKLEKLPMAEKEIETSARIWRGDYFINRDATEENFKQKAKDAKIIHIASHTIIDDEDPLNSKLVFSPGADTVEDGLLHTYELYNMQLNAQLACLSACNTGFGQIKSGEGVVSLAKGFFYAGVPNVMMSLWSVPDISTSEIMTTFHKELKDGVGKADALRNAKLKYLELVDQNTSDPYYWAAFIMIGYNQPIKEEGHFTIWIWIVAIAIGTGLLYYIVKNVW